MRRDMIGFFVDTYFVDTFEYQIDWPSGNYAYGIVGAETRDGAKWYVENEYSANLEDATIKIYEPEEDLGLTRDGQVFENGHWFEN